jgi:hypothetical protein
MWKIGCLLLFTALIALPASGVSAGEQTDFKVCKSTYALCTFAPCTPVAGKQGTVSCACKVRTGYSAGLETCQDVAETSEGKEISALFSDQELCGLHQ